ncbi:MAG: UbiD family decarboxylase [Chloroflexota bacterium]
MARDLRTFLKDYERDYPEDVLHIEKEVSNDQEITAIVAMLEAQDKYPVLVFHRVRNPRGEIARQPVIINVLASRARQARMCHSSFDTLGRDMYHTMKVNSPAPVVVPKTEAPVKEVVQTGQQVDLFDFPLLVHNSTDAGPYIASGFLVTYDPDSGIDNCALQRGWVVEKDKVRVHIQEEMHNGINLRKHEMKNQDMRVAYWIGHHPLAYIGGLTKLPYPGSHWPAMGGLLGEPLRLAASESLGDDFMVPADAEVIVEGIMEARKRYAEGPFGEFHKHVGPQIPSPQFKVTAVTYRNDAMWYDIAAGWTDHQGTGGPTLEGRVWDMLKGRCPTLQKVYMPLSGTGRYHVYLQFKNPRPAEVRQAIIMAATVIPSLGKHVFAFDDDVDIFNEKEVMWAIATRSQWDEDVIILPRTLQGNLDPSAGLPGENAAGGLDCTKPWGKPFSERVQVEPAVLARLKLEDYVKPTALARVKVDRREVV